MSQLLCYVSLSPVNTVLCYSCIRSGAVTIASHPSFWCILLFCLLTLPLLLYLGGISHSLLNCHLQPPLGLHTAFGISISALSLSWLSHQKHFLEISVLTLPLNPPYAPHIHILRSSIRLLFAKMSMRCLGLPCLTVPISFLSILPKNLFSLAFYFDCECLRTYFLNLSSISRGRLGSWWRFVYSALLLSNNSSV